MKWFAMLLMCFCAVTTCACGSWRHEPSDGNGATASGDPGPIEQPPGPLACTGACVETPPATYTGPSFFAITLPQLVPPCPDETPYQGLQGYVANPMLPLFARECKVTPSDLCGDEGLTCIPVPDDAFRVCIHHDGSAPCEADYPIESAVSELESGMPVTLCCKGSLLPG